MSLTEFYVTVDGWWPREPEGFRAPEASYGGPLVSGSGPDGDRYRYHRRQVERRDGDGAANLAEALRSALDRFGREVAGQPVADALELSVRVERHAYSAP